MHVMVTKVEETLSERLKDALTLPNGARFYRCALQVNPFAYLERHNKESVFKTEADYNAAIIKACLETGTEVIGVTDHYRVQKSDSIDSVPVREMVGEILEGGKDAFEMRRSKYGF